MVYIKSWKDFRTAAESLYEKSPNRARWVVKYNASKGILDLKITDNFQCIKYKTKSSSVVNRFEALNLSLMRKMQNRKPPALVQIPAPSAPSPVPTAPTVPPVAAASSAGESAAASASKKKKSKRK
ncbi:signal recognition particle, SRP9/SRP14 subunit [Cantharellus anzutake]|uniref:signal recognition particle, SRP9/SRP14 subunit n=1 Tax=Cantharellus anzutake TaxID=1750568 RepID=UPI0019035253|nr:signal recognition particle, SRP9/SRP14 subunit [Cantharellus anzutake]KAF8331998.1 signal recognition particle, SRP9/SRP14 subunit [Cantharellus anzutake]